MKKTSYFVKVKKENWELLLMKKSPISVDNWEGKIEQ